MRPKASSMITFGWIGLATYMVLAGLFRLTGDGAHTTMFLVGAIFWIVVIFVWHKTKSDEERP